MQHVNTVQKYIIQRIQVGTRVKREYVPDDDMVYTITDIHVTRFIDEDTGQVQHDIFCHLNSGASLPIDFIEVAD